MIFANHFETAPFFAVDEEPPKNNNFLMSKLLAFIVQICYIL